jgi:hypothetical protein
MDPPNSMVTARGRYDPHPENGMPALREGPGCPMRGAGRAPVQGNTSPASQLSLGQDYEHKQWLSCHFSSTAALRKRDPVRFVTFVVPAKNSRKAGKQADSQSPPVSLSQTWQGTRENRLASTTKVSSRSFRCYEDIRHLRDAKRRMSESIC